MNPTAIENHLKWVLLQWMVIIMAAWIFGRLGKRWGQPLAVGEIFAGLILGPSAFGALWPEGYAWVFTPQTQTSLQLLGKLGLILLLFQVGMEFDYSHLKAKTPVVSMVAISGLLVPIVCGWLIGPWLHANFAPQTPYLGFQLFICVALAITALPIMGRILLEMKLEKTCFGVMAISSAAIDDVAGWILLAVITALATSGFAWTPLLIQIIGLSVFFGIMLFAVGPALRYAWTQFRKNSNQDFPPSFLAILLVVLFCACLATNLLGVFSIFGAFILGVSLHQQTDLVRAWRERYSDLILVAFVPVFFTNTGLRTEIGSLSSVQAWVGCLVVTVTAVLAKLGGCYAGARIMGCPKREAATIAALMNTRALMGLIAINVGADLGLLPKELFTMFVIMALITTAMTGPLLKLWLPPNYTNPCATDCFGLKTTKTETV